MTTANTQHQRMNRTRRYFLKTAALGAAWLAFAPALSFAKENPGYDRPNVILILNDDIGYGDLACHGNPFIKTPNLDKLHAQSVRLTDFHVSPLCAPTRAAFMTGRHSRHVGVRTTNYSGNRLSTDVPTMADLFAGNGYRTGIFGKWHLGNHFPYRPQERGFQEVIIHGGGAITTVADVWGNDYFDDTYWHNGRKKAFEGYCTDVWFDQAMTFIRKSSGKPFFVYLPTNAAHAPMIAPEEYAALYSDKPEPHAHFFGMITNLDSNMGRLLAFLDKEGLLANTVLIFVSDNGSQSGSSYFNAGMKGGKGSSFDGGHRVPFFIHWPNGGLEGGKDISQLSAHIDLWPTLVDLCGLKHDPMPLDGISVAPQLLSEAASFDRTLIENFRKIAMTSRWRLVDGDQLYDISTDPGQEKDVSGQYPEVVQRLQDALEKNRQQDDENMHHYIIGARQDPVEFTPDDWSRGVIGFFQSDIFDGKLGFAPIPAVVSRAGTYRFELRRWPEETGGAIRGALPEGGTKLDIIEANLEVLSHALTDFGYPKEAVYRTLPVDDGMTAAIFEVDLQSGIVDIAARFLTKDGKQTGAYFLTVRSVSR